MRLAPAFLVLSFVLLTELPVSARPACAEASLRLNEIMAGPGRDWNGDGTFSSRDDEWVEVINPGAAPIALDGFVLMDGDSLVRMALTGTLAAGGTRVIYGKESYDWEKATGHPAFGFSLSNSGDRVTLWQVVGADTMFVDGYTYSSHQGASDRSVGRAPGGAAWMLFDALDPYSGSTLPTGSGCAPTPGAPNSCGTTPARNVTWGQVKTLYR